MKKIFVLCIFSWAALHCKAQTVTDTTYTDYADSSYHVVHDSVPDSTAGQQIAKIFEHLSTTEVTTGILVDRSVPFVNLASYKGDSSDSASKYATVLGLIDGMNNNSFYVFKQQLYIDL